MTDKHMPRGTMTALNTFAQFRFGYVQPEGRAGQIGPGVYTISSLCNLPFLGFVGLSGREKIYSWGEMVEVENGDLVTVVNKSFHPGDVVLNAGRDYAATPRRITVPVGLIEDPDTITPIFSVDTRRARAAWLAVEISTSDIAPGTIEKTVRARERSAVFSAAYTAGPFVTSVENVPANTTVHYVPLGAYTETPYVSPMFLLDEAICVFNDMFSTSQPAAYVVEY